MNKVAKYLFGASVTFHINEKVFFYNIHDTLFAYCTHNEVNQLNNQM